MLSELQEKLETANTNLIQANNSANNSTDIPTNTANTPNASVFAIKSSIGEPAVIRINGGGVSGIAVTFIFFITVLIGVQIMMAIFVNTKTIDEPLRMGRIEH